MFWSTSLALACLGKLAWGHVGLWDPALYGWTDDPNESAPVTPLMNLNFDQWWFHGWINSPPAAGQMMELPAGGTYHGQVACNKALTTYGQNPSQQTGLYACDGDGPTGGIGAMHTADAWESPDPKDVKGCGIGIAYESDPTKIQPEDFAVISINYTCPWFKHVDYQIPADLPPCPEGGCHCSWGWIHADDAGSEQMYHLVYKCNVTGATGTQAIPPANTANKCDYPTDTSNCTVGAKQNHYWYQNERNNNFQGHYDPPFYNGAYGFMNGAQTDLFARATGSVTPQAAPSASSTSSSTSSTSTETSTTQTAQATSSTSPMANADPTSTTHTSSSTSTAPATPTNSPSADSEPSTGSSSCSRRKRALDSLSSPEEVRRHKARAAKRAKRRAAKEAKRLEEERAVRALRQRQSEQAELEEARAIMDFVLGKQ